MVDNSEQLGKATATSNPIKDQKQLIQSMNELSKTVSELKENNNVLNKTLKELKESNGELVKGMKEHSEVPAAIHSIAEHAVPLSIMLFAIMLVAAIIAAAIAQYFGAKRAIDSFIRRKDDEQTERMISYLKNDERPSYAKQWLDKQGSQIVSVKDIATLLTHSSETMDEVKKVIVQLNEKLSTAPAITITSQSPVAQPPTTLGGAQNTGQNPTP